jgi:ATP adenylyltransferase
MAKKVVKKTKKNKNKTNHSAPKSSSKVVKSKSTVVKSNKNEPKNVVTKGDLSKNILDKDILENDILAKDIWPLERDILFRPDRYKYVRKLIAPSNCVFCEAAQSEPSFATLCLYQSEYSMIVLNKYPYNSGHLLVLPKKHGGELLDLAPPEFQDLHQTLRLAFQLISEAYQPSGINVGMNHGAVAGAGIPDHLHYHLVPRWAGDLNFFPLIAETKTVIEGLDGTYERLQSILKKI